MKSTLLKKVLLAICLTTSVNIYAQELTSDVTGATLRFEMQASGLNITPASLSSGEGDAPQVVEPEIVEDIVKPEEDLGPPNLMIVDYTGSGASYATDEDKNNFDGTKNMTLLGDQGHFIHFKIENKAIIEINQTISSSSTYRHTNGANYYYEKNLKIEQIGQDGIVDRIEGIVKYDALIISVGDSGWFSTKFALPAGEYKIKNNRTSDSRVSTRSSIVEVKATQATPRQDLAEGYTRIKIDSFSSSSAGHGRIPALTDNLTTLLHSYDRVILNGETGDYIDFTINEPSVVEFYQTLLSDSTYRHTNGANYYYEKNVKIEQIGQAGIVDENGNVVKYDPLIISVGDKGWFSTKFALPAGQYRLKNNRASDTRRSTLSYISEIRALTAPALPTLPAGQVDVIIDSFSTSSAGHGRIPALTDNLTSLLHSYDRVILNGETGDYIDFTINEPSVVEFYQTLSSGSTYRHTNGANYYYEKNIKIEQIGQTGIVDENGSIVKYEPLIVSVGDEGWFSTKFALPAGQYRLKNNRASDTRRSTLSYISEIRAFTAPTSPTLPAGQVDVIIDSFSTSSAGHGRIPAITDNSTTLLHSYDRVILNGDTGDYINFTLNESSVVEIYQMVNSNANYRYSANGAYYPYEKNLKIEQVGQAGIVDENGDTVKNEPLIINVGDKGWFSTNFALPAGQYRLKNSRASDTRGKTLAQVSEIRAFPAPAKPQLPSGQNDITVDSFSTSNTGHGRIPALTDNLVTLLNAYDRVILNGDDGDYINFTINEPSVVEIYQMVNSSATYRYSVNGAYYPYEKNMKIEKISGSPMEPVTVFSSNTGWASSGVTLPAGEYRIKNNRVSDGRVPTLAQISEIRAIAN